MTQKDPTVELETVLLRSAPLIIALDEVGRGAIAGPVTIGAAVVGVAEIAQTIPKGLRDSKLVAPTRRAAVAELAGAWVRDVQLGWATAGEVDELGIMGALGIAADRAITTLGVRGHDLAQAVVLLDGNHDYVSRRASATLNVRTVVGGDRTCASLSAASIHAKVLRDAVMVELDEEFPVYGWRKNKGYASATHRDAIRVHGLTPHHRASWAIA